MGGVSSPDLAGGLAAAVARLAELADVYERLDIGDGWVETPCTRAREIAADLRVVLAAAPSGTGEGHRYLSTGCLHGEHGYCQGSTGAAGAKRSAECKFCAAPCLCSCHAAATASGGER